MSTARSHNKLEFMAGLVLFVICAFMFKNSFSISNENWQIFMGILGFFGSFGGIVLLGNSLYHYFLPSK